MHINTCTNAILEKLPIKLCESFLVYLKLLWAQIHKQMLHIELIFIYFCSYRKEQNKTEKLRPHYNKDLNSKGGASTQFVGNAPTRPFLTRKSAALL